MKDVKLKRHLAMMSVCEKGYCDSDFIKQIQFSCKHCLVYKSTEGSANGTGLTRNGCNEYQAKRIAKDYMKKYNKAKESLEE